VSHKSLAHYINVPNHLKLPQLLLPDFFFVLYFDSIHQKMLDEAHSHLKLPNLEYCLATLSTIFALQESVPMTQLLHLLSELEFGLQQSELMNYYLLICSQAISIVLHFLSDLDTLKLEDKLAGQIQ